MKGKRGNVKSTKNGKCHFIIITQQQAQRDLQAIIRELRFITSKLKKKDDENDLIAEWKFAAMVVDRICLFVFTMFTIIATLAVLFSAPHIIVQ